MRMDEARAALSEAFTTQIQQAFERSRRVGAASLWSRMSKYSGPGVPPAWNADQVPQVRPAVVEIRRGVKEPAVLFTWKVEYNQPPVPILAVTADWLREVVRPGHVVLGGYPVLDVVERGESGRPAVVLVAVVSGTFDSAMHGWRAHAEPVTAEVNWSQPAAPSLTLHLASMDPPEPATVQPSCGSGGG